MPNNYIPHDVFLNTVIQEFIWNFVELYKGTNTAGQVKNQLKIKST